MLTVFVVQTDGGAPLLHGTAASSAGSTQIYHSTLPSSVLVTVWCSSAQWHHPGTEFFTILFTNECHAFLSEGFYAGFALLISGHVRLSRGGIGSHVVIRLNSVCNESQALWVLSTTHLIYFLNTLVVAQPHILSSGIIVRSVIFLFLCLSNNYYKWLLSFLALLSRFSVLINCLGN